jgi:hypothetical protein
MRIASTRRPRRSRPAEGRPGGVALTGVRDGALFSRIESATDSWGAGPLCADSGHSQDRDRAYLLASVKFVTSHSLIVLL